MYPLFRLRLLLSFFQFQNLETQPLLLTSVHFFRNVYYFNFHFVIIWIAIIYGIKIKMSWKTLTAYKLNIIRNWEKQSNKTFCRIFQMRFLILIYLFLILYIISSLTLHGGWFTRSDPINLIAWRQIKISPLNLDWFESKDLKIFH